MSLHHIVALFFFAGSLSLAAPHAAAQTSAEPPRLTLSAEEHEELLLRSLDGQRNASTALFVAGPVLVVGGALLGLFGWLLDTSYGSSGSWWPSADRSATFPILGASIAGVGLALLGTAIGLRVDVGQQRRAIEVRFAAGLTPLPGGAAISVGGAF